MDPLYLCRLDGPASPSGPRHKEADTMWLFAIFVLLPLIEISLFITIGSWLTLWPTLAIVLLSAVVGSALIRRQGAMTMMELRRAMEGMRDP
ncbi:FxsA family protein, partial [Thioclava sp. BHET1]